MCKEYRRKYNAVNRFDPTRTLTIRDKYSQDFDRRYKKLIKSVRGTIFDNHALQIRLNQAVFIPGSSPDMMATSFGQWLLEESDEIVGGIERDAQGNVIAAEGWQDKYIIAIILSAMRQSDADLRKAGVRIPIKSEMDYLNDPMVRNLINEFRAINYNAIAGVNLDMSSQAAEALRDAIADGYRRGLTIAEIEQNAFDAVEDRINKIGRTRSEIIARTETIESHSETKLDNYARNGVLSVGAIIEMEFVTAGDDRVCFQCIALEGRTFSIFEARGIIPVHPRCRCTWIIIKIARPAALSRTAA